MTRQPPRLPLALLQRFVPDSEPLIGDLAEQHAQHQSSLQLWRQVLPALYTAILQSGGDIRPLKLVDQQPLDALERTRAVHRRRQQMPATVNPLPAGIGLVIVGGLVTALAPVIWWGLVATTIAGVALAAVLFEVHKRRSRSPHTRQIV
jgi:hypothetical protein